MKKKLNYDEMQIRLESMDAWDYYPAKRLMLNLYDKPRSIYFGGRNFPPASVLYDKENPVKCLEEFFLKLYTKCYYRSFVTMGVTAIERQSVVALLNLKRRYKNIEIEVTNHPDRLFPLVVDYEDTIRRFLI